MHSRLGFVLIGEISGCKVVQFVTVVTIILYAGYVSFFGCEFSLSVVALFSGVLVFGSPSLSDSLYALAALAVSPGLNLLCHHVQSMSFQSLLPTLFE